MSDLRFLITGATGATGGTAAVQLLEQGRQVRAFVHRADERPENLRKLGAEVEPYHTMKKEILRVSRIRIRSTR